MTKCRIRSEFGDFQTPSDLADSVCALLLGLGISPTAVLEPTCGRGSFLCAAAKTFTNAQKIVGVEINPEYSRQADEALRRLETGSSFDVITADFFSVDWKPLLASLPSPMLVLGNPPWVTNSELGTYQGTNVPQKSNFQEHRGIDAITGKGNFDISEYILLHAAEWLNNQEAALAMLCKTAVARKVLRYAWKKHHGLSHAAIYLVDAKRHFSAAVDACLLVMRFQPHATNAECEIHADLLSPATSTFGFRRNRLVADISKYDRWSELEGGMRGTWRSGIKHDCANVMELASEGRQYRNGFGNLVKLEETFLFPMLKSSDLGSLSEVEPRRFMLVPQEFVGQQTERIRQDAPLTWNYLNEHATRLADRSSSIYSERPRFSIFGTGAYSFTPWKVAISGLYKKLAFRLVGPYRGRPVVMDDTCYFYPCRHEGQARMVFEMLHSRAAQEFLSSLVFWDEKRPITAEILNRLDLTELAKELGIAEEFSQATIDACGAQKMLF